MFERSEDIAELVNRVYAALDRLDRGDTLPRPEIASLTGLEPNRGRWQTVLDAARERLLKDRGIGTRCDRLVGVRLLTIDQQQTWLPEWRLKRAGRQIRRAEVAVAALPDRGLSLHQQRMKAFALEQLDKARRETRQHVRELAAINARVETLPRVPLVSTMLVKTTSLIKAKT